MQQLSRLSLGSTHERSPAEEVKLAATAISLDVRLRPSDMPAHMQDRALRCARLLLDSSAPVSRPNPTHLARALKKVKTVLYIFSLFLFVFYGFFSVIRLYVLLL